VPCRKKQASCAGERADEGMRVNRLGSRAGSRARDSNVAQGGEEADPALDENRRHAAMVWLERQER
jgi:hypothetical protein